MDSYAPVTVHINDCGHIVPPSPFSLGTSPILFCSAISCNPTYPPAHLSVSEGWVELTVPPTPGLVRPESKALRGIVASVRRPGDPAAISKRRFDLPKISVGESGSPEAADLQGRKLGSSRGDAKAAWQIGAREAC